MDEEVKRLVYQNAVLETELRFARHQLLQAQNANDYLLARISNPQPAYQTLRPLPASTLFDEQPPLVHQQEQSVDSGYLDSAINPQTATPRAGGPYNGKVPWSKQNTTTEARSIPTSITEGLKSHKNSEASISSNGTQEWDLKFLRKKPAKDSFGLGILNVKETAKDIHGDDRVANQGALPIRPAGPKVEPNRRQTLLDHQQGDIPLEPFPDFYGETDLTVQADDGFVLAPGFQNLTAPHSSDHKASTDSQQKLQTPRYHELTPSNSPRPPHQDRFSRPPPTEPAAFRRFSPRHASRPYGPQAPEDLFADPRNAIHHALYRSVFVTNIPPEANVHDTLETVEGVISTRIIKMAGIKTKPPMLTDTVKINFESSVAAVKFVEYCSTKPFAFEPVFYLARTGTSGDFGKQKFAEVRRRISYHDIDYSEGAGYVALEY